MAITPDQAKTALDAFQSCGGNKAAAARSLGLRRTTYRERLEAAEEMGIEPTEGGGFPSPMGERVKGEQGSYPRTYVVTTAQNATPVDENFYRSLQRYCNHRGATLLVIPFRYRNPTSIFTSKQEDADWWHEWVADYLISEDTPLNDNLLLAGSIMTQPTAKRPLSGMEAYSGEMSAIFGHSKIELVSVATPQSKTPKILTTTGSITRENYSESKAGKLGEFAHITGATVVEVENESRFHLRQINACDDGSFIDLNEEFTPYGVKKADRPEVLTCGDVHHRQMDPVVEEATFGENGIVSRLNPQRIVLHDLYDNHAANHHHIGDFPEQYRKHRMGLNDVYQEIKDTLGWLKERVAQKADEVIVVRSNHDEALQRWLNDGRGDKDPKNAWTYHTTWAGILPHPESDEVEVGDPFEYWYGRLHPESDNVRFLQRNDHCIIGNVEHALHGDIGVNGAKGNLLSFNRLGIKTTTGHSHGPAIHGGAVQVGVLQTAMRYNERGPSNWLPAHCIQYQNGKRSLIMVIDGQWTTKKEST